MKPHEAGLSITSSSPPKISVNVSFTSPLIREEKFDDVAQPGMNVIIQYVCFLLIIVAKRNQQSICAEFFSE